MLSRVRIGALLVFLGGLGVPLATAQPFAMRAELKAGTVVEVQVTVVTAWGFRLDTGQGLRFRQINQLQTRSETLSRQSAGRYQDLLKEITYRAGRCESGVGA